MIDAFSAGDLIFAVAVGAVIYLSVSLANRSRGPKGE